MFSPTARFAGLINLELKSTQKKSAVRRLQVCAVNKSDRDDDNVEETVAENER